MSILNLRCLFRVKSHERKLASLESEKASLAKELEIKGNVVNEQKLLVKKLQRKLTLVHAVRSTNLHPIQKSD